MWVVIEGEPQRLPTDVGCLETTPRGDGCWGKTGEIDLSFSTVFGTFGGAFGIDLCSTSERGFHRRPRRLYRRGVEGADVLRRPPPCLRSEATPRHLYKSGPRADLEQGKTGRMSYDGHGVSPNLHHALGDSFRETSERGHAEGNPMKDPIGEALRVTASMVRSQHVKSLISNHK
jgi:hypothetical protein